MAPAVDYTPDTYGELHADVYDAHHGDNAFVGPVETTVGFLRSMADADPVLELGIGTGRIALPLAEAGVEVDGIDVSPRMVERLRAKPGGEAIPVTACS